MIKKEALILLLISLLFSFPFFHKGYFSTHDGEWAIIRLAEMNREIGDLQLPPRWSDFLNHGYGYPLFLFTYPLPYYMGELIHLIGVGFTDSIKALFIVSVIISAFGMYFFSKRYWGTYGAFISSVLYITVPYRLIDLYVRGSIGESIAMAVVPWLFYFTDRFLYKNSKNGIILSILLALLILSHNASALFFVGFLFIYVFIKITKNFQEVLRIAIPYSQGLLISSFFWLPAILERKYIYLSKFPIANRSIHFASIPELLGFADKLGIKPPLPIGILHLVLVAVIIFYIIKLSKQKNKTAVFFIISFFTTIFLVLPISSFLWRLPLINSVDFPWRILILTSFISSFITGAISIFSRNKLIYILLIIGSIIIYFPYLKVENRFIKSDDYYETNDGTTTSNDELMPIWVTDKPTNRPENKVKVDNALISDLYYTSKNIEFKIVSPSEQQLIINTLYFPGWKFWINKKTAKIQPTPETGLISLLIPKGEYQVKGRFSPTYVSAIADILSILGISSLILSLINYLKHKFK